MRPWRRCRRFGRRCWCRCRSWRSRRWPGRWPPAAPGAGFGRVAWSITSGRIPAGSEVACHVGNLNPSAPIPRARPGVAPPGGTAGPPLLLVALDRARVAEDRLVRVLAVLAAGAPLPEQVPALVELHLDGPQSLRVARGEALADVRLLQMVLLVHQLGDSSHDLPVVQPDPSSNGIRSECPTARAATLPGTRGHRSGPATGRAAGRRSPRTWRAGRPPRRSAPRRCGRRSRRWGGSPPARAGR